MDAANFITLGSLQKMGIMAQKQASKTTGSTKRRSAQVDFGTLKPLKQGGTVGFSTFRDGNGPAAKNGTKSRRISNGDAGVNAMVEDSDEEEDGDRGVKMEDDDDKDLKTHLSPEDAKFQGELADGVGRIKVSNIPVQTRVCLILL